jgi:ATP-binding cassette subfamily F protein 3
MLDVEGLTLRLGEGPLFDGISCRVTEGQRVALAGRNGQGKSTLMRAIMGQIGWDSGKIILGKGRVPGYLPQDITPPETDRTAVEETLDAFPQLASLEEKLHRLTDQIAADPDDASLLDAYGKAQGEFEALDGYAIEAKAKTLLDGLGFSQERMDAPLRTLSGGWLMRVHLAKLLLLEPDLLLLDEPTNHLDIETREWLLTWLQGYAGALILTSHDRFFLDQLVNKVFLLEGGQLDVYHGNYSDYEVKRAEALDRLKAAWTRQQKELKRQQRFIEKNRAKAATASNVQSRIKQVEKIELIQLPPEPPDIKLRFPEPPSSGALAFRTTELGKAYGETRVLSDVNLELPTGEKLAVVGVNGAGKTTLLELIKGALEPTEGKVELGHNVTLQTFSQYEDDLPDPNWSMLQAMEDAAPPDCTINRRSILGCFLFSGDDVHKTIGVLSGGERARLKLARMLLKPSNLLILDEPTNHLDLHSKDILLAALKAFTGTVVFVSHDRQFLAELATSVLEVKDGRAVLHPCNYEQFRWRSEREQQQTTAAPPPKKQAKQEAKQERVAAKTAVRRATREQKRAVRKLRKESEELQAELEANEARVTELEAAMSQPGFFDGNSDESQAAVLEHKQLQMLVGAGYERLEEVLEALEAAEAEAGEGV